ncbi:hypothetical protein HIM_00857 [Hirsutella minnesotensis 3608]|nr:hypothetical protein HIM_00857 [Hirsutella minnesotensis 3608]
MASKPSLAHSDLQLRARKAKTRSRIVIPLPSRPRDYVPGTGPPLQSICLLPPQDSTAYIVERILLPSPGLASDGKPLPRRMTYIVGWRDLPAARLLVPAMQILDYVPPRALEEWEAQMELELDRDRKKLAEEKDSGEKKARPPAHTDIESAAVAEPETGAPARPKMGVMSLSTPQKARLIDFEDFSDDYNGSPSRQIASEADYYTTEEVEAREVDDMLMDGADENNWNMMGIGLNDSLAKFRDDTSSRKAFEFNIRPVASANLQTPSGPSSRMSSNPAAQWHAASPAPFGGFTPFNGRHTTFQTSNTSAQSTTPIPASTAQRPTPSKPPKSRKKPTPSKPKPTAQPSVDDNGEPTWVVQRLEDMRVYDVEGRGIVRYFQVRWEGDWPPDQNPTWEPEDNIPQNMVRNYFKRSKKRRRAVIRKESAMRSVDQPARARKVSLGEDIHYKSVSEAFAGDIEDASMDDNDVEEQDAEDDFFGGSEARSAADNEDLDKDVFVIEEQQPRPAKPTNVANVRRPSGLGLY